MDKVVSILVFTWMFFLALSDSIAVAIKNEKIRELSDELTFYKEQYELLKSEQKQDHFDDNDLDNGGVPDAR